MKKMLVIGEVKEGEIRNVSYEAIAAAKLIADVAEVVAVVPSDNAEIWPQPLFISGQIVRLQSSTLPLPNIQPMPFSRQFYRSWTGNSQIGF